jgi:hypothetical protein
MPFVGDVDNDGLADMIVVYPPGGSIIDVALNVEGQKTGVVFQALNPWGRDCQAAVVGDFDATPGTDVVGLFDGDTLQLACAFSGRRFKNEPKWCVLPGKVSDAVLASVASDSRVLVFSKKSGEGYSVQLKGMDVQPITVRPGTVWIGDAGEGTAYQTENGDLFWEDGTRIGSAPPGSRPAAGKGVLAYGDTLWTESGTATLAGDGLPAADTGKALGDADGDGDLDLFEFRYGSERHTAHQVTLRRRVSAGETDPDHDGLTNLMEKVIGSDPLDPDTDGDGLLDGWEADGVRGLDLPGMGCSPLHFDLVCLISRFSTVKQETVDAGMARVTKFYSDLPIDNADGKPGLAFHPVYLDEVGEADQKSSWQANRAKFRPEKWRGIVHWMQVTPGGGGQADQLGDGGTVGQGALWAVFAHEFGHQMGLDHEGFWRSSLCPTYTSMMNYAYSYSFEDDGNKVHYSDGRLVDYVLRETDLDETIPLPYDKVKFLEKGPYRFRLKENGETTLIDWNWNGVFGEKNIRADINYSYSTNAGRRDDVGRTMSSPWLFVHGGRAFALFAQHSLAVDPKIDPTTSNARPSKLVLRRLREPFAWDEPWTIVPDGVTGDPVAGSAGGSVFVFYQTTDGVVMRKLVVADSGVETGDSTVVDKDPSLVPTVGTYKNTLYLFLWNPSDGKVTYRTVSDQGSLGPVAVLPATSTNPVGMCEDTVTGEAIVGLAQDQDEKRPNRWQVRRYSLEGDRLVERSMEWVSGESGASRGVGRITVLFESSKDAGPDGRIHFYGRGMTSAQSPWACTYVAMQISDKSVGGGWLVKRFYDEWTQTRSAPAAAWFAGDIIWAYRWVDGGQGASDNILHVGYRALGIEDTPMGDHDDLGFISRFGIRSSIISLGAK